MKTVTGTSRMLPAASAGLVLDHRGRALATNAAASGTGGAYGVTLEQLMTRMNRWREGLNPRRNLTIASAVGMIENAQRGAIAELMWTYAAPLLGLESSNHTLMALIEQRVAPLLEMDYQVKMVARAARKTAAPADRTLAEEQAAFLQGVFDNIENLYEAIGHLELAVFRGISIVQPQRDGVVDFVSPDRLEIFEPWLFARQGFDGPLFWNPTAQSISGDMLPQEQQLHPDDIIVREVRRCVNRIALINDLRESLADKDYASFIEIYGVPSNIVIGPPDLPIEKESDFEEAATRISEGSPGYLPYGSTVHSPDATRGMSPFEAYLDHLQKRLVLAGTGGLLTMLSLPQGIGNGANESHAATFKRIARGSARRTSELLQRTIGRRALAAQFPGRPQLAYFELAFREEQDTGEFMKMLYPLAAIGRRPVQEELEEKIGIKTEPYLPQAAAAGSPASAINRAPAAPAAGGTADVTLADANRLTVAAAVEKVTGIRQQYLGPWFQRLEAQAAAGDLSDGALLDALEQMVRELPEVLDGKTVEELAKVVEGLLGTAMANGIAARGAS